MRSIILALSVVSLICSCSEKKSFKGGVSEGQIKKVEPKIPEPKLVEKSQEFDVTKASSGAIDMLWVIDNSGSMSEEAAQVRKNFDKFMASVSAEVDLRVTVISDSSPEFGVTLSSDATAKGHAQIAKTVRSTNLLLLAASSLCDPAETNVPDNFQNGGAPDWNQKFKLCGLEGTTSDIGDISDGSVFQVRGKALERARPNASKVVVFVTDDDAYGIVTPDNFLSSVKLDSMSTHVYAFRGDQSRESCEVARPGKAYEALATTTKGEVFDICLEDWSQYFAKLTSNVISIAKNGFTIQAASDVTIKKVYLDGVEVPASGFTFANKEIKILDQLKLSAAKKLRVVYEVKEI